jgi:hypothetical protein
MKKTIIYTTLPHYREGNLLKLSVAVSIRLEPAQQTTLGSFPDILNWTEAIKGSDFSFRLNNIDFPATLLSAGIDSPLWSSLFPASIKVNGFEQQDFTTYRLRSYPGNHITRFIEESYKRYAISHPKELISTKELLNDQELLSISRYKPISKDQFDRLKSTKRREEWSEQEILDQSRTILRSDVFPAKSKFIPYSPEKNPAKDFSQLRMFHLTDSQGRIAPLEDIKKPTFEFHDIISVLSSYPQVQRKLGLVLDFEIPYAESMGNGGKIQCIIQNTGMSADTVISCPQTAYELTDSGFYIKSKDEAQSVRGFLSLNSSLYYAHQIDADGVAIKLNNLMENKVIEDVKLKVIELNLQSSAVKKPQQMVNEEASDEGMPHIRSAGIAIGRNGLSEALYSKFEEAKVMQTTLLDPTKLNAGLNILLPEKPLYAEDLTKGYRMDVAYTDDLNTWYSLHFKKDSLGFYTPQNTVEPINGIEPDEGFVQLGAAEKNDIEGDLFTSETLFRWEGWSLAVRRPGYALNEADDDSPDTSKHKDYLSPNKQVEGAKYLLDKDLEFKMQAEPALVPGTLPKLRFGEKYMIRARITDLAGNSVPLTSASEDPSLTYIRSFRYLRYEPVTSPVILLGNSLKDGESVEHMTIRSNFDRTTKEYEAEKGSSFEPLSVRHVLAPKNGQMIAENHGKFDGGLGSNPAVAKELYQLITSLDSDFPKNPDGQELVYEQENVELVYLPDPMAAGASIFTSEKHGATHAKDDILEQIPFFGNQEAKGKTNITIPKDTWYKADSFRIILREGDKIETQWKGNNRILEISVPKGQRLMLKYSSWWRAEDIENLSAIWRMVSGSNEQKSVKGLMEKGMHWMISPSRELELVHAVQQPVEAPVIEAMEADREYEEVTASISLEGSVHGYSTEQIDLKAQWTEIIDEVVKNAPEEVSRQGQINDIKVSYHDKKLKNGVIVNTNKNSNAKGPKVTNVLDLSHPYLKQRFQDTKHRMVRYQARGTSRYTDHFDILSQSENLDFTRVSTWFENVIIPSSARPVRPEVDYVIPTFEWRKTKNATSMRHHRVGGGLRVYLKRPWYSSGDGERLAVIYAGKGPGNFTNTVLAQGKGDYNPLITQWAIDPIKLSVPDKRMGPEKEDFRFNPVLDEKLAYTGREEYKVDVAAYPVEFDEDRNMYRCDISINPGRMYFPFIRLALARYQQHSVRKNDTDVCLSPIVYPDPVQLVPDRIARVDFLKDDLNSKFTIRIEGPISHPSSPGNFIELFFLNSDLAQPQKMVIEDGTNDKKLEDERVVIHIKEEHIKDQYFTIEREFKLPRQYKSDPFIIVIQEFELGPTSSVNSLSRKDDESDENKPRLVYADRFEVNAKD